MPTYNLTDGQSQSFSFTPVPTRFGGSQGDTINVSGAASIDASATGYESLAVNLASNTHLTAGFHLKSQNTLAVNGDASTSVTFVGTSEFGAANNAVIQPDVLGTGTLIVNNSGDLDLSRGAAAGINVELHAQPNSLAILVLEQPGLFKGSVDSTEGLVALRGLSTATDYDLSNGVLTIYGGANDQVLDTLRFVDSSPRHADTLVTLSKGGEVDVTEDTGTGPFNGGAALAQHVAPPVVMPPVTPPTTTPTGPTTPPVTQPSVNPPVLISDGTTGQPVTTIAAQPYTGPVSGIAQQVIAITAENLNVLATQPNLFIHTGSGTDAIQASSGTNVLDGGTGSNFLTAGTGTDTFFVDARGATADTWSTVVKFHSGDAATLWGVSAATPAQWFDGQGAAGATGLTLHAGAAGDPTASITLADFSRADMAAGKVTASFGHDEASGSDYLYLHGT